MSRLKRATQKYGGGSGQTAYESKAFRVVLWTLSDINGTKIKTSLNWNGKGSLEVEFDGVVEFNTDDDCFEQLTAKEIMFIVTEAERYAMDTGSMNKATEIRKALNIDAGWYGG